MGPDHCRRERGARPKGRGGVEPELPRVDDNGAAEDQKARGHPDGSFGRGGEQARDVAVVVDRDHAHREVYKGSECVVDVVGEEERQRPARKEQEARRVEDADAGVEAEVSTQGSIENSPQRTLTIYIVRGFKRRVLSNSPIPR